MKVLKRIISILLVVALMITTFSACSSFNLKNMDNILTKGEWIDILGNHFGYENENDTEAYFSDVSKDDDYFRNVQACVEWGVIKASDKFNPDVNITKEYAFATAVRAIGNEITGLDDDVSDKVAAKKAKDLGLAESQSWTYMHSGVTAEEAEEIGKKAAVLFCGREIVNHDNTTYQEDVIIQENIEGVILDTVDNKVTIPNDKAEQKYAVGDIVVFGTGKNLRQVKITSVTERNGKTEYDYEIPEIYEVYDEIDVGGKGVLEDVSDVKCEDGVTLSEADGVTMLNALKPAIAESLGLANENDNVTDVADDATLKFDISFGSGTKLEVKPSYESGSTSIEGSYNNERFGNNDDYEINATENGEVVDASGQKIPADLIEKYEKQEITTYKNGAKKTVTTGHEYKKGWKVTGSVSVSGLNPSVDIKTKKFLGAPVGFKSFDIVCNPTFNGSISVEGYVSIEKTIATVAFQAGPITIEVGLKMAVDLNGKVTFGISIKQSNSISYSEKNGFKKVSDSETKPYVDFEATLKITPVKIILKLCIGWFNLIDASISAAIEFSLKLSGAYFVYSQEGLFKKGGDEVKLEDAKNGFLFCREYKLVLPIIELELGTSESLLGKIGLSFHWTIMAEEDAPLKSMVLKAHCEGEALNKVDQCTLDTLEPYKYENPDEAKEDENYDESTTTGSEANVFTIDKYTIDVEKGAQKTVTVSQLPKGYSIGDCEFTSSDNDIAKVVDLIPNQDGNGEFTVEGISEGNATITVKTKDGKYQQSVLVIVIE